MVLYPLSERHLQRVIHDSPIIVELVIEIRLFESSCVDCSKPTIYAIDTDFIRTQANDRTMFEVCFVYGLYLNAGISNP